MYVKGDYIISNNATFLDIEQSKQTKVREEIWKLEGKKEQEVYVDKGPRGKIVERVVYEKNKHIFPFRNWKTFDPTIDYAKNPILEPGY